jgi:hypothetical protein
VGILIIWLYLQEIHLANNVSWPKAGKKVGEVLEHRCSRVATVRGSLNNLYKSKTRAVASEDQDISLCLAAVGARKHAFSHNIEIHMCMVYG